ncbi:Rieske (2Fe-2S) protein [Gephyromycinifex aptenodytis]|uniref:Rieske (2Fe-2S) protein n=1 Tax=Gephyromycinifex aptenodytis TaxID=2716227 RepID=UPI00144853AB|nr:Rieske (2Fe-2S) protein [Gephyromycinifex aptenodytis]
MGDVSPVVNRRVLLKAAGVVATLTVVAGCSSRGESSPATEVDIEQIRAAADAAVAAGEVPVGGAAFLEDVKAVVTQPTAGDYKVFSDVCHHANGRVSRVDPDTGDLVCVLHGSVFDPATGAVKAGPSPRGLDSLAPTATPSPA